MMDSTKVVDAIKNVTVSQLTNGADQILNGVLMALGCFVLIVGVSYAIAKIATRHF